MGIDPGLNVTGYGVIATFDHRLRIVVAGDIRPPHAKPMPERLAYLHRALNAVVTSQRPDVVVLETVFTHQQYVGTAALMAHARGVSCLVAEEHQVPLVEYSPARVKQALTGRGAASKEQVARMVTQWLDCREGPWSLDATDALALAIAHAHMQRQRERMPQEGRARARVGRRAGRVGT